MTFIPSSLKVRRAPLPLRTSFFKTREREKTSSIGVQYVGTLADPRFTANDIDAIHCARGAFGVNFHYIIRLDGTVEIGRNPRTISTRTRNWFAQQEGIAIGLIGGFDEEARRVQTTTPEQARAVELLIQAIADALNTPLEIHDGRERWSASDFQTDDEIMAALDADADAQEANMLDGHNCPNLT